MSKWIKFAIGLAAALVTGWVSHGPLSQGSAFIDQLDGAMVPMVDALRIPGVLARMQREPLARTAILSGPADCFQRNGLNSYPGIDRRVLAIPGVARVEWTNPPPEGECR